MNTHLILELQAGKRMKEFIDYQIHVKLPFLYQCLFQKSTRLQSSFFCLSGLQQFWNLDKNYFFSVNTQQRIWREGYNSEDFFQHHVLLFQVLVILETIYRSGIRTAACGQRSASDKITLMDALLLDFMSNKC